MTDDECREALLERVIGELTLLAQRSTAIDLHLQMVDRTLERLVQLVEEHPLRLSP